MKTIQKGTILGCLVIILLIHVICVESSIEDHQLGDIIEIELKVISEIRNSVKYKGIV